jgi:arginine decarboxylase
MTTRPLSQDRMPYYEAVRDRAMRVHPKHHWAVPDSKLGLAGVPEDPLGFLGRNLFLADLPHYIPEVDLPPDGHERSAKDEALELAAMARGAAWALWGTNGATGINHALGLGLAHRGARVIVADDGHVSQDDGFALGGVKTIRLVPGYNAGLGMTTAVSPGRLRAALAANPGTRAVYLVSPSYTGYHPKLAELVEIAHEAGAVIGFDCSWSGFGGIHPDMPPSVLGEGADFELVSHHKSGGGALTGAAALYGRSTLDEAGITDGIRRALRLFTSTSSSAISMMSLDWARWNLVNRGRALLDDTLTRLKATRELLQRVQGIRVLGADLLREHDEIGHWNPMSLVLDTRGTGLTGFAFADRLRRVHGIETELRSLAVVVFHVGLGQSAESLGYLVDCVQAVARSCPADAPPIRLPDLKLRERVMVMDAHDALLAARIRVPVDDAVRFGLVSAQQPALYPPGRPAFLYGQQVVAEDVEFARLCIRHGCHWYGGNEPDRFDTIDCVRPADWPRPTA